MREVGVRAFNKNLRDGIVLRRCVEFLLRVRHCIFKSGLLCRVDGSAFDHAVMAGSLEILIESSGIEF